ACVPLLEIVSEPDIRSAGEAVRYVRKLREILVYLGVCDGNMNEGSLRVDANVSVRPVGQEKFGTRTETKNVNSFKFLEQAINYERQRQIEVLEDGGEIVQETRLFDAVRGITVSMRSKEEAHDYRYFPDPDLLPVVISQSEIEDARASLPELPDAKRERFVSTLGLPKLDAEVLCQTREMADFFESVVALHNDPKAASNWMMGGVLKNMNRDGMETLAQLPVKASHIAGMLDLMKSGAISSKIAKDVFEEMWTSGKSAAEIVKEKGLTQISDTSEIEAIVDAIIAKNPSEFERLKGGDQKLTGFFVGQIMRESKGKANPGMVNDLLKKKMEG
ncbi:Asp-tRNA(Asn)/Glu-tRNA(Gln) amidotransferase subunit GatB, partial [bacterium]